MKEIVRDCANCIRYTPDGCSTWTCDYINRKEAIRIYEKTKKAEAESNEETGCAL